MEPKMVQGPAQDVKLLCMQNLPNEVKEYMEKELEKRTTDFWRAEVRRDGQSVEFCCANYEYWLEYVAHVLLLKPIFESISKTFVEYGAADATELAHWQITIEHYNNYSSQVKCNPKNFLATLFDFMKESEDKPLTLSIWSQGVCFCGNPNELHHHYQALELISFKLYTKKVSLSHAAVFDAKDRVDFASLCRK